MKLYISGPISGLQREVYRKNFAEVADWLSIHGHQPINPTELDPADNCGCKPERIEVGSHVSLLPPEHAWGCYLKRDLIEMLMYADGVLMLPGWQESHGARLEFNVAVAVGLKAFRVKRAPVLPIYVGPPMFVMETML